MELLATISVLLSLTSIGMISQGEAPDSLGKTTIGEFYGALEGEWGGPYSLWLNPGEAPRKSEAAAQGRFVAQEAYFLLTYSWFTDDKDQEGVFLLGGAGARASATWGDSWHMQPTPMVMTDGELIEDGKKLVFLGSYGAGPGQPDWGWRTEFTLQGENAFLMEAYNITPKGLENLAVRAELTRK